MNRISASSLRREGFKSYRIERTTDERTETKNQLSHYAAWLRKRPAHTAFVFRHDLGVVRLFIVPYQHDNDKFYHYAERPMTDEEKEGVNHAQEKK